MVRYTSCVGSVAPFARLSALAIQSEISPVSDLKCADQGGTVLLFLSSRYGDAGLSKKSDVTDGSGLVRAGTCMEYEPRLFLTGPRRNILAYLPTGTPNVHR
jgi:hypothetical protein